MGQYSEHRLTEDVRAAVLEWRRELDGAQSTPSLGTTEVSRVLGSSSDTWGHTWTPSELPNGNFRFRVINVADSRSRDFFLAWVGVLVHYQ